MWTSQLRLIVQSRKGFHAVGGGAISILREHQVLLWGPSPSTQLGMTEDRGDATAARALWPEVVDFDHADASAVVQSGKQRGVKARWQARGYA